jgi:glycosyltransferase involved in cell wall biosynthesis
MKEREHADSGGWMMALLEQLRRVDGVELSVACASPGLPEADVISDGNVRFYPISQGPAFRLFGFRHPDSRSRYLDACARVVQRVTPDIIHIHGTERLYGLLGANNLVKAPCLISLQGILQDYVERQYYFGVTPLKDIVGIYDLLRLPRGMGSVFNYLHLRQAARRESVIMRQNRWFAGRTEWDKTHLLSVNPRARYFHVPELLRSDFYRQQWSVGSCQRHRIVFTNANTFRRGTETLIDAAALLRRVFPDIRLALAGGVEKLPYGKKLRRRLSELGLNDRVDFLGNLNAAQLRDQLCQAHVFAITSLLENSPNSLCEAQMVGVPCIASYAGGMPSLVTDHQTGLFFPPGDAPLLAARIKQVFTNDGLARTLGAEARTTALRRHDPASVSTALVDAYEAVIADARAIGLREQNGAQMLTHRGARG